MRQWIKKHPYVLWVLYLPVYLVLFFAVEKIITTDYWVSYCWLDDWIPFIPAFVVFYTFWYPLMIGTGLYLLWKDPEAFTRYMYFTSIGLTLSLLICLVFPNGQELRPAVLGDDVFSRVIGLIYAADTNTNVLPSMHVVGTSAVMAAWYHTPVQRKWVRPAVLVLGLLINASTVLIKQHSFLDILAGLVVAAAVYVVAYRLLPVPQRVRSEVS